MSAEEDNAYSHPLVRTIVLVAVASLAAVACGEAAASMGASPSRIRRDVDLPIARRALVVGAGFAFAISLGGFGPRRSSDTDPIS